MTMSDSMKSSQDVGQSSEAKIYRMTEEARRYHRERRAKIKAGEWIGRKGASKPATAPDTLPSESEQNLPPPDAA